MKRIINRYTGKVFSMIKQHGFFNAIKNIFIAAYFMLKPIGKGDVLFISSGVIGNSARYRMRNVAEELEISGFKCGFAVQEHPFLLSHMNHFDVFILQLVNYTPQIKKLIEKIKAQGKEIIFETDDLLFEPELVKQQDFYKNANALQKKFYEHGIGTEILDDPYVKVCTTTTNFLASKLSQHGKKVFLVPNKLSKKDLEIADRIMKHKTYNMKQKCSMLHDSSSVIKIGYFSGAHSHNKDFATITDALMQIMEKYENVELCLVGPLDIESKLNKFADRIKQFPYATREKHFVNVACVDINIAPLEIGNPFCEAKSELKFFEAGIVQVPTVAAATEPFRQSIEDGIDGFVANGTQEWIEKLSKLIEDNELIKTMGEKARKKALEKYTTINAKNEDYYNYLRSKLSSSSPSSL